MSLATDRWFHGERFWLNKILRVELDINDHLVTDQEREEFYRVFNASNDFQEPSIEVHISDARSGLDNSINSDGIALSLKDLNPEGKQLLSALMTTFDFPDDIDWLKKELSLQNDVELTICSHPWPERSALREDLWRKLSEVFEDVVLHFPGSPQLSCPQKTDGDVLTKEESCSVHAKLFLLEFHDRLRMVITSANLCPRHWEMKNEILWLRDFPRSIWDLGKLLESEFTRDFSHFLLQTLHDAPKNRREAWLSRLAEFDLSCEVRLVLSLPGLHVPAVALQDRQLALRLFVEEPEEPEILEQVNEGWLKKSDGFWKFVDSEGKTFNLDESSLKALVAAESLQLRVVETGVILGSTGHVQLEVIRSTISLVEPDQSPESEDEAGSAQVPKLLLRLILSYGDSEAFLSSQVTELADLLAQLEVDYGLFAMRRHLSHEEWRQSEEEHYVAITSAISSLDESWFRDLDQSCGRLTAGLAGGVIFYFLCGDMIGSFLDGLIVFWLTLQSCSKQAVRVKSPEDNRLEFQ